MPEMGNAQPTMTATNPNRLRQVGYEVLKQPPRQHLDKLRINLNDCISRRYRTVHNVCMHDLLSMYLVREEWTWRPFYF
jgi:hypothetical protein